MPTNVTYDRPVAATLHVHLENGETFEATPEDFKKFGYVKRDALFSEMYKRLTRLMDEHGLFDGSRREITDMEIGPLFSFFSYIINYPHLLDHWENEALWTEIVNVELRLRDLEPRKVPSYEELQAKQDMATTQD